MTRKKMHKPPAKKKKKQESVQLPPVLASNDDGDLHLVDDGTTSMDTASNEDGHSGEEREREDPSLFDNGRERSYDSPIKSKSLIQVVRDLDKGIVPKRKYKVSASVFACATGSEKTGHGSFGWHRQASCDDRIRLFRTGRSARNG